jgi:ribose transport system ATP-binding protein
MSTREGRDGVEQGAAAERVVAPGEAGEPILRLRGVTKRFPGVLALADVDMDLRRAEVHGLLGENGAGKSTLIKILTGAIQPDGGELLFEGRRLERLSPRVSLQLGIACIYQELNLIPHLTVAENIFLGREPRLLARTPLVDRAAMRAHTARLLADLGLALDPGTKVGALGIGHQQMVEICKAVSTSAKLIIMDEPTASLTQKETEDLFRIIAQLKAKGVTTLFISHHLEEAKRLCSTATVLRDGRKVADLDMAETTIAQIIRHMVGREITDQYPKARAEPGVEALSVEGLGRKGKLHDISFKLRVGEVLGFAGLVGSGRTELARAIMGADPMDEGRVKVFGREVRIRSPRDAIRQGIALLTEDRKDQGLILIQDIAFNSTLVRLDRYARWGILNLRKRRAVAEKLAKDLCIRPPDVDRLVGHLSGGNQQKVVIAKWLSSQARIFIFDEPTRGIDVGAKVEVYNLINALVREGAAVIIICSELPEVLGMADRILVMHEGRVSGEFRRAEATQEKVMYASLGVVVGREASEGSGEASEGGAGARLPRHPAGTAGPARPGEHQTFGGLS